MSDTSECCECLDQSHHVLPGALLCTALVMVLSLYWLVVLSPTREQKYIYQLKACYKELHSMVDRTNCQPLLLRLAWSDAVSYDCMVESWPHCGGVNGSIRFDFNLARPANAGLSKAIGYLKPLRYRYPIISWADLIQMVQDSMPSRCNAIWSSLNGYPTYRLVWCRSRHAADRPYPSSTVGGTHQCNRSIRK